MAPNLYSELKRALARPEPFSVYTAEELWTDPHTSERMLQYHLHPDIDVSSRKHAFIEQSVAWMSGHFGLGNGKRVIDFGCGPGLYTSRLAACGAEVSGVDFSVRSIGYAREQAQHVGQDIVYHHANYLEFQPAGKFDLICMIMCDFCALSPAQRSIMLSKFARLLSVEGRLVLDVYSLEAFRLKQELVTIQEDLLDGFWSPSPYVGIMASFKYEAECASLDKYTIVEDGSQREVYNWLQYYSPETLEQELVDHGLVVESVLGDVAGSPYDPQSTEFAVVAKQVA